MSAETEFKEQLVSAIPSLRAFALSMIRDRDKADDLVQEAITRAWTKQDRFEPGTNLMAWLFTILRNTFYSHYRKQGREVADPDGAYATRLKTRPEQQSHLDFKDMQAALQLLPSDQREALLLIAAEGLSYEEVAEITGVAVGTVKSRVNRARGRLAKLLAVEDDDDVGPDPVVKAVLEATT
jgi:RNA polymerase sigma-70 factor (ECF subfamily)